MSAVRMCDRQSAPGCHKIFSERAEGWSTGQLTVNRRDENGRSRPVTETIDSCPACTGHVAEVGPLPVAIQAYREPTPSVPDDAVTEVQQHA